MRAVVVYESMYGNTHLVADAIGAGLSSAFDVAVIPVAEASQAVLAGADLVVVGGPTHLHGMSRAATRKAAVQAAGKPVSPLNVEPDALGPGLREWFSSLERYPVKAAAFDTRLHGPAALTGQASKGVARLLRAHGFDVIAEPESFIVTKQDRLEPQETNRAREWGAQLAATVAHRGVSAEALLPSVPDACLRLSAPTLWQRASHGRGRLVPEIRDLRLWEEPLKRRRLPVWEVPEG